MAARKILYIPFVGKIVPGLPLQVPLSAQQSLTMAAILHLRVPGLGNYGSPTFAGQFGKQSAQLEWLLGEALLQYWQYLWPLQVRDQYIAR